MPYAAGGPIDVTARALAERVKDSLGPVIIDNKPGAGGNLGADLVATTPGVVEHVNKLVAVRALRARYAAEVGDVVVGRVTEVGARETEAQAEAAGMRVWEGRAGSRDSSPQRR